VSGLKRTTEKNLMVFSGRAHPELAEQVAELLGAGLVPTSAYDFANSEIYVRFEESVRGSDAFVIQSHTAPVNEWIMEHLIMVDALKRASAKRITVVLPFYGYARQDKKHRGREPISARLVADLLKTAGAHRIMTIDLHTDQIQGFFDGPVDHLLANKVLAEHLTERDTARRRFEREARADAALIEGRSEVTQAKLTSEAVRIQALAELEQLKLRQESEIEHTKALAELEISRSRELAEIEAEKFKNIIDAIGADTITSIARAGPEMQAKLLSGLGLQSFMITDGKSPINLFGTANGLIGGMGGSESL